MKMGVKRRQEHLEKWFFDENWLCGIDIKRPSLKVIQKEKEWSYNDSEENLTQSQQRDTILAAVSCFKL